MQLIIIPAKGLWMWEVSGGSGHRLSRFNVLEEPLRRHFVAQSFFFGGAVGAKAHRGELHAGADVVEIKRRH